MVEGVDDDGEIPGNDQQGYREEIVLVRERAGAGFLRFAVVVRDSVVEEKKKKRRSAALQDQDTRQKSSDFLKCRVRTRTSHMMCINKPKQRAASNATRREPYLR